MKDINELSEDLKKAVNETIFKFQTKMMNEAETRSHLFLDGWYLGVRSGKLKRSLSSMVDLDDNSAYLATSLNYGAGWETGNMRKYVKVQKRKFEPQRKPARPEWVGIKRRPFLSQAILDTYRK